MRVCELVDGNIIINLLIHFSFAIATSFYVMYVLRVNYADMVSSSSSMDPSLMRKLITLRTDSFQLRLGLGLGFSKDVRLD